MYCCGGGDRRSTILKCCFCKKAGVPPCFRRVDHNNLFCKNFVVIVTLGDVVHNSLLDKMENSKKLRCEAPNIV